MPMRHGAIFKGCEYDNFSDGNFLYFSIFCSKHRLWIDVKTAALTPLIYVLVQINKNVYPCKSQFDYIKLGSKRICIKRTCSCDNIAMF